MVSGIGMVIALAVATCAVSANAKVGATQGAGSRVCSVLEANWKRDWASTFTWGQGFMDGLNKLRYVEGKPVIDLNPDDFQVPAQMFYVQVYCRQHPADEVVSAFYELYKDLATHHGVSFP